MFGVCVSGGSDCLSSHLGPVFPAEMHEPTKAHQNLLLFANSVISCADWEPGHGASTGH